MANLPEINEFTTGIYQLEVTDPNEAGPDGVLNYQARALANRTLWLKNQLVAAQANLAAETAARIAGDNALQSAIAIIQQSLPKNKGWFAQPDPGGTTGSMATFGDITGATATSSVTSGHPNSIVIITMANAITSDYYVESFFQAQSGGGQPGVITDDATVLVPAFKRISDTQFSLAFVEGVVNVTQRLKVHLKIYSY